MRYKSFRLHKVFDAILISCLILFIQLCQPFLVIASEVTQFFSGKILNEVESDKFIDTSRDGEQLFELCLDHVPFAKYKSNSLK